jgi:hypothetical protein
MSDPVAHELKARRIPYIFTTGYAETAGQALRLDAPVVQKPYSTADILDAFAPFAA